MFEAYYLLEARGLIQARPRSGYYVNALRSAGANEPTTAQPAAQSSHVEISELVFQVLGDAGAEAMVRLWHDVGDFGQYSNEGFDTQFAPELAQRYDRICSLNPDVLLGHLELSQRIQTAREEIG